MSSLDKIKQLFRAGRYEVAILETDSLLKEYPVDSKLYEMKGTLLSKLGKFDLAEKAWKQALELNPNNQRLKNFMVQKGVTSIEEKALVQTKSSMP